MRTIVSPVMDDSYAWQIALILPSVSFTMSSFNSTSPHSTSILFLLFEFLLLPYSFPPFVSWSHSIYLGRAPLHTSRSPVSNQTLDRPHFAPLKFWYRELDRMAHTRAMSRRSTAKSSKFLQLPGGNLQNPRECEPSDLTRNF